MKATPFSKEPYYPMLLSNGQDGILVDYSGSNFCSQNGHTHPEQMLGAATGWYKASTRALNKKHICQVMKAGYQVIMYGVPCEPDGYEQWLDAEDGILHTDLVFQKELHISVESFLTDEGLWGEKIRVTACPKDWKIDIGFKISVVQSGYNWLKLDTQPFWSAKEEVKNFVFSYEIEAGKGRGALIAEQAFDSTKCISDKMEGKTYTCEGMYENIKCGDSFGAESCFVWILLNVKILSKNLQ